MTLAKIRRFSLEEYHHLTEIGFFHQDERVELVRGEIVQMAAKGTKHATCCSNLLRELAKLLGEKAVLRCQDPICLPSLSEPEPDFTIARLAEDNYFSHHPQPEDILLVIEIADSSLDYDQGVKIPLYAEANISNYWIFNLVKQHLECYSQPYQEISGNYGYSCKQILLPSQSVNLTGFPDLLLDLGRVFPLQNP